MVFFRSQTWREHPGGEPRGQPIIHLAVEQQYGARCCTECRRHKGMREKSSAGGHQSTGKAHDLPQSHSIFGRRFGFAREQLSDRADPRRRASACRPSGGGGSDARHDDSQDHRGTASATGYSGRQLRGLHRTARSVSRDQGQAIRCPLADDLGSAVRARPRPSRSRRRGFAVIHLTEGTDMQ